MKNIDNYHQTTINVLFLMFPLTLILGNLFTNLNVVIFCLYTLIAYNKNFKKFKINFFDKIILIFFSYIFITLLINFLESYINEEIFSQHIIKKTFFFFRYLVLYLVLRFLINQNILNLNQFSIACAICAVFICLDIFFQFYFGKDLFGIKPSSARHFSGVFGDELIAGGYLQKFALFTLFLPFIINQSFFYKISIQTIFFIIFIFGIILSGNRMPLILFFFSYFIYLLLDKKLKKYILPLLIFFFLFLSLNFSLNQTFKINAITFYKNGANLISTILAKNSSKEQPGIAQKPYVAEFVCARNAFKLNPFFGGGVRSYRTTGLNKGCTTHPHNYYFEIVVDLGLFGLSIILIFIFTLMYKILIKKVNRVQLNLNTLDSKMMPFFLIFITEFFPIRTSGSFFSTGNSTVIFIILAILVSLVSEKKSINF